MEELLNELTPLIHVHVILRLPENVIEDVCVCVRVCVREREDEC